MALLHQCIPVEHAFFQHYCRIGLGHKAPYILGSATEGRGGGRASSALFPGNMEPTSAAFTIWQQIPSPALPSTFPILLMPLPDRRGVDELRYPLHVVCGQKHHFLVL